MASLERENNGYLLYVDTPRARANIKHEAQGLLLGTWLSVDVWPPSFDRVPVAQWENIWSALEARQQKVEVSTWMSDHLVLLYLLL